MDRSELITLVNITYTQDSIGQEIENETERECFCNIRSASRNEFFAAGQNGIKAEWVVTMFNYDYQGETVAILNGHRYSVYRTYITTDDNIELYLEQKSGV